MHGGEQGIGSLRTELAALEIEHQPATWFSSFHVVLEDDGMDCVGGGRAYYSSSYDCFHPRHEPANEAQYLFPSCLDYIHDVYQYNHERLL